MTGGAHIGRIGKEQSRVDVARRSIRLASSGAYAPTQFQARADAANDLAALTESFAVAGEFMKCE